MTQSPGEIPTPQHKILRDILDLNCNPQYCPDQPSGQLTGLTQGLKELVMVVGILVEAAHLSFGVLLGPTCSSRHRFRWITSLAWLLTVSSM